MRYCTVAVETNSLSIINLVFFYYKKAKVNRVIHAFKYLGVNALVRCFEARYLKPYNKEYSLGIN